MINSNNMKILDRIVVVVRHGDRAPLMPFSFDRSKMDKLWPAGYGHLTPEGKLRMYRIGHYLRKQYSRQFQKRYISPRDVYIRSSAVDRCLESAQLIAAGLSPPIGSWIWKPELGELWQPVPIFTIQKWRDGLLNPSSTCLYADKLLEKISNSQIVKNYLAFHQDFINNISSILGEDLCNHRKIRDFFDNLLSSKHHGQRLPKWATKNVYKQLKQIFHMSFKFDYTGMIEPELRLLRTGVLLNEIFQRLDSEKYPNGSKLSIYVTHDSQLVHLQDVLGLDLEEISIKFGSMMIFEYSKQEDSVRLWIINNAKFTDPMSRQELKIPVCERNLTSLPLRYLISKYENFLIDLDQWDRFCQNNVEQHKKEL